MVQSKFKSQCIKMLATGLNLIPIGNIFGDIKSDISNEIKLDVGNYDMNSTLSVVRFPVLERYQLWFLPSSFSDVAAYDDDFYRRRILCRRR